jgi:hypothetical protein
VTEVASGVAVHAASVALRLLADRTGMTAAVSAKVANGGEAIGTAAGSVDSG